MRVSVTDIDAFRYWRENEDASTDELVSRLRREPKADTRPQAIGKAFHSFLEHASDGDFDTGNAEGFSFLFDFDGELSLPAFREVKAEKLYRIDGETLELVGVVDAMEGRTVTDHKTTSQFNAERFMDSMQWRFYLDMMDADCFEWNVFEIKDDGADTVKVRSFHPLKQWRYPGMAQDINRVLHDFVLFVRANAPDLLRAAA